MKDFFEKVWDYQAKNTTLWFVTLPFNGLLPLNFFLQRFATFLQTPTTFLQTPYKFSLNPKP